MPRQYVKCQFNPWDRRTYTYHSDDHEFAVGDKGTVETNRGEVSVEIVEIADEVPNFETKPISREVLV